MDFPSAWHLWLIAGLVAAGLEIHFSGFVMLWFAVGALGASLAAALGLGLSGQLALFITTSLALFAASRTLFQKVFVRNAPPMKIGTEAMIGAEAVVTEALPASGSGTVRINGELWAARSVDGSVEVGETVQVASVDGLKLKVRRAERAPIVLQQEKGKTR